MVRAIRREVTTAIGSFVVVFVFVFIAPIIGGADGRAVADATSDAAIERRLNERRAVQNHSMQLPSVRLQDGSSTKPMWNFGFAYLRSTADLTRPTLTPQFAFVGRDKGEAERLIELSEVQSFRVESVRALLPGTGFAVFEVTRAPALLPRQWLEKGRDPRALAEHREVVRLQVPLENATGELYLVGTEAADTTRYFQAVRVRDLAEQRVRIETTGAPWWQAVGNSVDGRAARATQAAVEP